jgi:hypothetical protein
MPKMPLLASQIVLSVIATLAAIGTISAASMSFPVLFSPAAWAHYVVLASLVHLYFSIGSWLLARLLRSPEDASPVRN